MSLLAVASSSCEEPTRGERRSPHRRAAGDFAPAAGGAGAAPRPHPRCGGSPQQLWPGHLHADCVRKGGSRLTLLPQLRAPSSGGAGLPVLPLLTMTDSQTGVPGITHRLWSRENRACRPLPGWGSQASHLVSLTSSLPFCKMGTQCPLHRVEAPRSPSVHTQNTNKGVFFKGPRDPVSLDIIQMSVPIILRSPCQSNNFKKTSLGQTGITTPHFTD